MINFVLIAYLRGLCMKVSFAYQICEFKWHRFAFYDEDWKKGWLSKRNVK